MIYQLCSTLLLIGVLGLLAQALLGGGHAGHAHGGHTAHHGGGVRGGGRRGQSLLWSLLSPLAFFSLCIGMGATGLLLKHLHLHPAAVAGAAFTGGIVFYGLLIRPLWGLIFQFASTPSKALEGTLAREAEALTPFDTSGKGLVRLNVDGQFVRILATLEPDERGESTIVRPGDRLTVTSVDGRTNSCRVARL